MQKRKGLDLVWEPPLVSDLIITVPLQARSAPRGNTGINPIKGHDGSIRLAVPVTGCRGFLGTSENSGMASAFVHFSGAGEQLSQETDAWASWAGKELFLMAGVISSLQKCLCWSSFSTHSNAMENRRWQPCKGCCEEMILSSLVGKLVGPPAMGRQSWALTDGFLSVPETQQSPPIWDWGWWDILATEVWEHWEKGHFVAQHSEDTLAAQIQRKGVARQKGGKDKCREC